MIRIILLTLPFVVACLDKPGRPSGGVDGPVGDDDARVDAQLPDAVYRPQVAVGFVNGDGFEDLVRWGNLSPGEDPRIWVYFGGDAGAFSAPSLALNPTLNTGRAWYEVLSVTIDDVDPGAAGAELVALVAEDTMTPAGDVPRGRELHVVTFNPASTEPLGRSTVVTGFDVGGLASAPVPVYIVGRNTDATGGREIVFGELVQHWLLTDTTGFQLGTPSELQLFDDGGATLANVQNMFDVQDAGIEHLIGVTHTEAWSSDVTYTAPNALEGTVATFTSGGRRRIRVLQEPEFMAAATLDQTDQVEIIEDVGANAAPDLSLLTLDGGDPLDHAFGHVGGTSSPDLLTLLDGELKIYRDLMLGGGLATPVMVFASPLSFDGYNLLAIGNFHGIGANEIYVLGDGALPPRCMTMTSSTTVEPCPI